jgi:hypothetical protein
MRKRFMMDQNIEKGWGEDRRGKKLREEIEYVHEHGYTYQTLCCFDFAVQSALPTALW